MGSRGTSLPLPKEEDGRVHVPKASNNHPQQQQDLQSQDIPSQAENNPKEKKFGTTYQARQM